MTGPLRVVIAATLVSASLIACGADEGDQPGTSPETTGTTSTPTSTTSTTHATTTSSNADDRPPGEATCSAARLSQHVAPQELPQPVEATRAAIIRAAIACDYETLTDIADRGTGGFTYSFGASGRPAEFWRGLERDGEPVLRTLVELLRLPFATRTVSGSVQYVWPSAYAYDDWADVPASDRQALRGIYTADDLEEFARFGSYAGYRVGMTGTGDWQFFIAGD